MNHRVRTWPRPANAKGSALLISLLVMVILTLLAVTYLFQADTENQISGNERDRAQVLGVAEAGARMVKRWFDRPITGAISAPSYLFLNSLDLRKKIYWDVSQRLLNADGDPGTAPLASGDVGWVYYMQGRLAAGSPALDTDVNHAVTFMQKPYRGSTTVTFMGLETGPDLRMSESSATATVRAALQTINAALFSNTARTGRITSIEIYEPPYVRLGSPGSYTYERYGIATVKVTAAKFRAKAGGGEEKIAERVVKMVLNELPYPGPTGPLQSCDYLTSNGNFSARWGKVTAMNTVTIANNLNQKHDSAIPLLDAYHYVNLNSYRADMNGQTIEDPFYYFRSSADITNFSPSTAQVAAPTAYIPGSGAYAKDDDHSNLVQFDPTVRCPDMPYEIWKEVAQFGGNNVYYFTPSGGNFKLNGTGTAHDFDYWTNNKTGLFFFDTTNGIAPDGTNLTPAIQISGPNYIAGFVYLNSQELRTTGGGGQTKIMVPPGEPFEDTFVGGAGYTGVYNAEPFTDTNANGIWDGGEAFTDTIPPANGGTNGTYDREPWVNLDYGSGTPPTMTVRNLPGTQTRTVTAGTDTLTGTTTNARDDAGLPITADVSMYGVFYNSGRFEAQGNKIYYGSVIGHDGVGPGAGTPDIYFDERLVKGQWPPPEMQLPLTMITVWKTDY